MQHVCSRYACQGWSRQEFHAIHSVRIPAKTPNEYAVNYLHIPAKTSTQVAKHHKIFCQRSNPGDSSTSICRHLRLIEALNQTLSAFISIDISYFCSSRVIEVDTAYCPHVSLGFKTRVNIFFLQFAERTVSLKNTRISAPAAREMRHTPRHALEILACRS